jgi:DNA-binding FrmR family transcriptional regulator
MSQPTHTLRDETQRQAITNRLKRAHGQLGAVVRMMEEGRNCDEVVTQIAAVSKAVHTAAYSLIAASLRECVMDADMDVDATAETLQRLFLRLA